MIFFLIILSVIRYRSESFFKKSPIGNTANESPDTISNETD